MPLLSKSEFYEMTRPVFESESPKYMPPSHIPMERLIAAL